MKTIAVVNQKGGCGKTTTAVNLAAALAEQQQNVLLLDLDPQAHATLGFGHDPDKLKQTLYDAVTCPRVKLTDVLLPTTRERLSLAPASVILASTDVELAHAAQRELIIGNLLKSVRGRFDVCVMDCAPSFGVLTIGALVASTDVIVPVQPHYYSLEGLRRVLETIRLIRERFHPCCAENLNVLLTLVENRTTLSRQIQAQMREIFGSLVFQTVIHNNVRLCEAPSAGESVLEYAPGSRGAQEYRALAAEVLGHVLAVETQDFASVHPRSSRRGMQKDLSELFGGVRPRTEAVSHRPVSTKSEATRASAGDGAGEAGNEGRALTPVPASTQVTGPAARDDLDFEPVETQDFASVPETQDFASLQAASGRPSQELEASP